MAVLWIGNDNLIRVTDLVAQSGGDEAVAVNVTTATVTAQIKDSAAAAVGSPITLAYQAGTDGDYEGIAPDTLSLTAHANYTIEITADDGPNRRAFWLLQAVALYRTVS